MPYVEADPPSPNPHFLPFDASELQTLRGDNLVVWLQIVTRLRCEALCAWGVRLLAGPVAPQDHEVAL